MSAPSTDTASTKTAAPAVESDAGGVNDKANELRELHNDELETRLGEAKEELFNLRFQTATGQLDNNRRLRTVRHDIARIYTILRERELGLSVAPNEGEGS
jgi:large subunit ribosomal protein L29